MGKLRGEVVQVVGSPFDFEQRAQMFLTRAAATRGDAAFGGTHCLEELALAEVKPSVGLGVEVFGG